MYCMLEQHYLSKFVVESAFVKDFSSVVLKLSMENSGAQVVLPEMDSQPPAWQLGAQPTVPPVCSNDPVLHVASV